MSRMIAACWDSSPVFSLGVVLAGVVLVDVVGLVSAAGVVVVAVFSDAFGVTAVSGIFGGLAVPSGSVAFVVGVVPSAPGVPGVVPAGVVAVGRRLRDGLGHDGRLARRLCSAPRTPPLRRPARAPRRRPGSSRPSASPACRGSPGRRRRTAGTSPGRRSSRRRSAYSRARRGAGCGTADGLLGRCGPVRRLRRRWRLPVRRSGRRIDERRGHWLEF